ncbi:divalent metal cation transporter [Pseudolysobacter antarcticus]|uniref:Divalent metal cation transporter n=1 Tax=Pseudolysobacter antarcticus TaxID=2511995 RepID=A0A411HIC1_9GAMM|nr:divalent metal cation transporter [Pseudolysobacter antarcticus]QBB70147.1 divalent metal cation transporter [Pseudolysobacter antarcticus]
MNKCDKVEVEEQPSSVLSMLGPGLVTGAADDDPSGVGTYSQVGAQFGFAMLWTMLFSLPLMLAVQEISARIGRVTGKGIAGNLHGFSKWITYPVVFLLFLANTINIGADIAAMGAAAKLLLNGPVLLYATGFALASVVLEVFVCYKRYAPWLKWMTMALFAYVATVFAVHVPWGEAMKATLLPKLAFNSDYLTALIAVLGTTISPYLFFWQASQEVEDMRSVRDDKPLRRAPHQAARHLWRIRLDTVVGMVFSALVAYFIILTCAVTLHAHGVTKIDTAAQAAEALRPVAGSFAFVLFALGIIGTGMLAIPVLAGSAAYGVGELLHWRTGLEHRAEHAKGFYGVITVATLLGLALNFTGIDPIKALFWSAVINGVVAVPVLFLMMLISQNQKIMTKKFSLPQGLRLLGWLTWVVMLLASIGMFVTW